MIDAEKFEVTKRVVGGIYSDSRTEVDAGEPASLNVDSIGRIRLSCTPFNPQEGTGQAIAFSAVAGTSTQLSVGERHWIWSTEACWIRVGGASVTATSSDFPLPPGAVTEYIPTTGRDYISAIQISQTGTLYIGQSA